MKQTRVAICGSGNRGRTVWQKLVYSSPDCELVGVQDPAQASLDQAIAGGHVTREMCFSELDDMLRTTRPEVVIVCTPNHLHARMAETALRAGCDVLVEKPLASELGDAVGLVKLARLTGNRLGVVQNWRTKAVGQGLRTAIREGRIGEPSHVFFRYVRDREGLHLPEYLFTEPLPLVYAMGVHHIDLFRYMLDDEIVRVEGRAFRPSWSRYATPSGVHLWFETARGVNISYGGTFSSRNAHLALESLVVEGSEGSLSNDSSYSEPPLLWSRRGDTAPTDLTSTATPRDVAGQYAVADTAILENFLAAREGNAELVASGEDNLMTLAVVDAVRIACETGRAVDPRDLLDKCGWINP